MAESVQGGYEALFVFQEEWQQFIADGNAGRIVGMNALQQIVKLRFRENTALIEHLLQTYILVQ
jgi:hypothetical protein